MADEVARVVGLLEQFTERLIVKITLDVTANLKETTPVDTGWARANWIARIGAPDDTDLSQIAPTPSAAASAQAQSEVSLGQVAATYTLDQGAVFVSNNVPYISNLNDGSSAQAPAGFVQAAVVKAITRDIQSIAT